MTYHVDWVCHSIFTIDLLSWLVHCVATADAAEVFSTSETPKFPEFESTSWVPNIPKQPMF